MISFYKKVSQNNHSLQLDERPQPKSDHVLGIIVGTYS